MCFGAGCSCRLLVANHSVSCIGCCLLCFCIVGWCFGLVLWAGGCGVWCPAGDATSACQMPVDRLACLAMLISPSCKLISGASVHTQSGFVFVVALSCCCCGLIACCACLLLVFSYAKGLFLQAAQLVFGQLRSVERRIRQFVCSMRTC